MWNLSQIRARLGDRLAETSEEFWDTTSREYAINEAQRFVAAVTKGVPQTISGSVDSSTPYLTVTGKLLGDYEAAGRVTGGRALGYVPIEAADRGFPTWPTFTGTPRWVIPAPHEDRVYLVPKPDVSTSVTVNISVLPEDLSADGDELFGGEEVMEKYQGVVLNIAASLCLLRERYDGDAERFYQFAIQELQNLGVNPEEIPTTVREVPQDA